MHRYNPDLSKTCMICDFGASKILTADPDPSEFHVDVNSINTVISLMLGFPVNPLDPISKEAEALMHARKPYLRAGRMMTDEPNTVAEFKAKFSWFRGSVSPSYPKAPTPLLQRKLIQRIGYLPEPVPETTRQWDEPGPSDTTLGPLRLPAHASYRSDSNERSRARSEEEVEAPAAAAAGPVETEERPKKSKSIGGRIRRSISRFGHAVARPFQQLAARRRERNEPGEEEDPQPSRHKSRDK